jgi:hypothetical protein
MCVKSGWEELVKEGEMLFDYMISNFENMIDGESNIKHFDIENGDYGFTCYVDEIKEKYYDDIQKNLIIWIKKEFDTNELFINNNWKPFRDPELITCMFLGYKKMFQFDKYMFQLILKTDCDNEECDCRIGKKRRNITDNTIHFGLTFYGWIDDRYSTLQPYNILTMSADMSMPAKLWK